MPVDEVPEIDEKIKYASMVQARLQGLNPEIPIGAIGTPDQIMASIADAEVHYVTGASDDETIRDADSGTGTQRWHRRDPYWYSHDECYEHTGQYRRRMQPILTDKGMRWEPEYPSDDDGLTDQPSFILPSSRPTDADGYPLPENARLDNPDTLWQEELGIAVGLKSVEDTFLKESGDYTVDESMVFQRIKEFWEEYESNDNRISHALDRLMDEAVRGAESNVVKRGRQVCECVQCKAELFHPPKINPKERHVPQFARRLTRDRVGTWTVTAFAMS